MSCDPANRCARGASTLFGVLLLAAAAALAALALAEGTEQREASTVAGDLTPEPTAEPTPEPTAEPTTEPTAEPTPEPPTPTPDPDADPPVYGATLNATFGAPPSGGGDFPIVVSITNTGSADLDVGNDSFALESSEGPAPLSSGGFDSQTLPAGSNASATLTFTVPAGATDLVLSFNATGLGTLTLNL